MKVPVINIEGKETGKTVDLEKTIFGIEPNDHAIYLDVKHYLAANRQGTHKSKERAEIVGSTRKIKKQKGTGTARFGSIKNPIFRGGGRVFGPRPKDYRFKVNKKVKQLARKSALTYKANDKNILVVEDFNFEAPKTKEFVTFQKNLQVENKKTLLILNESNNNIYLSSRNLEGVKVVTVSELATYDIMRASTLMFVESSIDILQKKN